MESFVIAAMRNEYTHMMEAVGGQRELKFRRTFICALQRQ